MKCTNCGLTEKSLANSDTDECPDCGTTLEKNQPKTLLEK